MFWNFSSFHFFSLVTNERKKKKCFFCLLVCKVKFLFVCLFSMFNRNLSQKKVLPLIFGSCFLIARYWCIVKILWIFFFHFFLKKRRLNLYVKCSSLRGFIYLNFSTVNLECVYIDCLSAACLKCFGIEFQMYILSPSHICLNFMTFSTGSIQCRQTRLDYGDDFHLIYPLDQWKNFRVSFPLTHFMYTFKWIKQWICTKS